MKRYYPGLMLLALASGALAQVLVHLAQNGQLDNRAATGLGLYVASFLALYLWLRGRGDPVILPVIACLVGLGLAEIWRLDPARGWQQTWWVALGTVCFAVASRFRNWHLVADLKYVWAVAAALLLVVTIIFGNEIGGARAWLRFGRFSFQASELAKLMVVAYLAAYLADTKEFLAAPRRILWFIKMPPARHLGPLLLMWFLFMVMFVFQRDLGGALLLFGVFVLMVYTASNRLIYITLGSLLVLVGGSLAYTVFNHVRTRFIVWLNPWQYYQNIGYQIIQGLFAMAQGGLTGTGLGMGFPYLIPAAENDFIFNALVEELGLLGGTFILAMYMILVARSLTWAVAHGDDVEALAGVGLATLLGLQAIIIIGGVTRMIPVTGVTLPFLSYGGSSMLASFVQMGLIYSLSVTAAGAGSPQSAAEGV